MSHEIALEIAYDESSMSKKDAAICHRVCKPSTVILGPVPRKDCLVPNERHGLDEAWEETSVGQSLIGCAKAGCSLMLGG